MSEEKFYQDSANYKVSIVLGGIGGQCSFYGLHPINGMSIDLFGRMGLIIYLPLHAMTAYTRLISILAALIVRKHTMTAHAAGLETRKM